MRVGLIADDVTGAGDASVQFARRGWETFLSLDIRTSPDTGSSPASDRSVFAVTTDARSLDSSVARARTRDALVRLMGVGIDRVFLKIDSTMRGSVPGQIAGALDAWQSRHAHARAIVCPAYPRMGRTVEAGHLYVNGEPVHRTAIGRDPVTPVTTSDMSVLVPASPSIAFADAESDAALGVLAAAIAAEGPHVIAVGSGGLAEALADALTPREEETVGRAGEYVGRVLKSKTHPTVEGTRPTGAASATHVWDPRILLLVTSLNPVSHTQVARLRAVFPDIAVVLAPQERVGNTSIAENLASDFVALVERERWDVVGLIGGDGARAALRRLGASGIRIIDSVVEGVPFGLIVGGQADGLPVFTKAGGFGAEEALVTVVERMRA